MTRHTPLFTRYLFNSVKNISIIALLFIPLTGCALFAQENNLDDMQITGDAELSATMNNNIGDTVSNTFADASIEPKKEHKNDFALLRPNAIRDAAQLVAIQTAMKWRYEELLSETHRYAYLLDSAFNFIPLLMTHEEATVMPPILAKSQSSLRIDKDTVVTVANTSYEMLAKAKYISVTPNWRTYLMIDSFPEPEEANPDLLPKNNYELKIWRSAFNQAWLEGVSQADELFLQNISQLVRDYKGVMLYHILLAQNLLTKTQMAASKATTNISKNKMHIGQKVFRITSPSRFSAPKGKS